MQAFPDPIVFSAESIRAAVSLDHVAIAVVEAALRSVVTDAIEMPPVQQITVTDVAGQTCVKSAFASGGGHFVTKVSSIFPANAERGFANASGVMLLFDATTGAPRTILLDRGWLTAVRTAAAGAVAAKWMARSDSRIVAVIGGGRQARLQVEALKLVFNIAEVRVHARSTAAGLALTTAIEADLALPCRFDPILGQATRDADIVVCATGARAPILNALDIGSGTHVTAMGSDAPGKCELADDLLRAATTFAGDSLDQSRVLGELQGGRDALLRDPPVTLGALIDATHVERRRDAITIADLTGLAIQDLAIAELAAGRLS